MAKITVIIPAYNARGTIGETLDSLRRQTFKDFAVIVVDDGSTDGTADFVAEHSPDVQLVRQVNGGPSAARNAGVGLATSEWIAFLDADDAWLPHRLETQMWFAERHPEVILWAGESVSMNYAGAILPFDPLAPPQLTWIELADMGYCNMLITTTVLVRREAFNSSGGFDLQFRGPEDYDLWIRITALGKVGRIELPLIRYREVENSLSNSLDRFLPDVVAVLHKNYGAGGTLAPFDTLPIALAITYFQCSFVASQSGQRWLALRLLARSWMAYPWPIKHPKMSAYYSRLKYLYRYLVNW